MNESELLHQFWEYNRKNPIGSIGVAMYLFLLDLWFKNQENEFKLSDTEICERLKITRPTIISLRQKLQNLGFIQYQSQNGLPCCYRLISEVLEVSTSLEIKKNEKSAKKIKEKEKQKKSDKASVTIEAFENKNLISDLIIEKSIPDLSLNTTQQFVHIPSKEEFINYAKTFEMYDPSLEFLIEKKYNSWKNNGWRNSSDRPVTNWKSSIKSLLPYLKNTDENNRISVPSIPNIKRPKLSSDQ
jgi:hypothetical protein